MEKKQTSFSLNKVTSFLKRNIYYVLMIGCVLAIGAIVTTVALVNSQDTIIDAGGNPPIVTPDPTPDPEPEPDPDPPVIVRDFIVTMPVMGGTIADSFNDTVLVWNDTLGKHTTHQALDIAGALGSNIIAGFEGVIESITTDFANGSIVTIKQQDGFTSVYTLVDNVKVKVGDKVGDQTVIGTIGTFVFESAEAPHVHYELHKDGVLVNPELYMLSDGK